MQQWCANENRCFAQSHSLEKQHFAALPPLPFQRRNANTLVKVKLREILMMIKINIERSAGFPHMLTCAYEQSYFSFQLNRS